MLGKKFDIDAEFKGSNNTKILREFFESYAEFLRKLMPMLPL